MGPPGVPWKGTRDESCHVTLHLSKNKGKNVSHVEYSRVIGSLMHLMSCIKPDIVYAVSKLSSYTSNLGAEHWQYEIS